MEKKPLAIFVCGPIAAGKSSTIKYFNDKGYEQGVVLNYDSIFKSEYDRLSKENKSLSSKDVATIAEASAISAREAIFKSCLEKKLTFSYENCMSSWSSEQILSVFQKMEAARKRGFNVRVYVTFQKLLKNHIDTEQERRKTSKEIGAFFTDDKSAAAAVKSTYNACLQGMKEAMKYAHSMKIFINYMNSDPEQNRPKLVAHYQNNNLVYLSDKIDNKKVKEAVGEINNRLEKGEFYKKGASDNQVVFAGIRLSPEESAAFWDGKEVLVKGVKSKTDASKPYDVFIRKDCSKKEGFSARYSQQDQGTSVDEPKQPKLSKKKGMRI